MAEQETPVELGLYEVTIGYNTTTMKLSEEHAQEMANSGQGVTDSNGKELKPEDGSFALGGEPAEQEEAKEEPPAKARSSAANKARSAPDTDAK